MTLSLSLHSLTRLFLTHILTPQAGGSRAANEEGGDQARTVEVQSEGVSVGIIREAEEGVPLIADGEVEGGVSKITERLWVVVEGASLAMVGEGEGAVTRLVLLHQHRQCLLLC